MPPRSSRSRCWKDARSLRVLQFAGRSCMLSLLVRTPISVKLSGVRSTAWASGSGFLAFLGASLALACLMIDQFHPRVHFPVAFGAFLKRHFFPLAQHSSVLAPCSVLIASHLCFPFVFSLSLFIVYLICSHLSTLFQLIFTILGKHVENSLTCGYQNVTLLLAKKGDIKV